MAFWDMHVAEGGCTGTCTPKSGPDWGLLAPQKGPYSAFFLVTPPQPAPHNNQTTPWRSELLLPAATENHTAKRPDLADANLSPISPHK
jgi:hypothetical protein